MKKQNRLTDFLPEELAGQDSVEQAVIDKDMAMQIHKILHTLNEPYKEVFWMRTFGELSFAEIGKVHDKTEAWARVTYHRARKIINETDKEMARLFEVRMDAAKVVAEYKKVNGLPVDDFAREAEIIARNTNYINNEEYRSYYVNFLKGNIDLSKKLQHKLLDGMRVAYSGVEGAFAHIAAKKIFPKRF